MISEVNKALEARYAAGWNDLVHLVASVPGASQPFLVRVPDGYARARTPLMIVGQETYGWGIEDGRRLESIRELTDLYADFDLGRGYRASPFWRAAHTLNRNLNDGEPEASFLWTNLVRVDCDRRRPPRHLEEFVARLRWLNAEVELTAPRVVVFFTGPRYDDRMLEQFPGAKLENISQSLARVRHSELPALTFRTYHPKYLALSKEWGVLDEIADASRDG